MRASATLSRSGAASQWRSTGEHEHFVQFYADEGVILEAVNGYVMDGLNSGSAGIVIATRPHLEALEQQWTSQGLDLAAARQRGQYATLEAVDTLSAILVDGWPQAERFAEVIEPLFAAAGHRYPQVVAFGEMVALLWKAGQHAAAIRMEELWNDLARRRSFALFCAYPAAAGTDATPEMLRRVCEEHSRAIPTETYTGLADSAERLTEICALQDKAQRLESEVRERKAVERQLLARETMLRLAVGGARMGVWTRDLAAGLVHWSPELENLFGLQPGGLGNSFASFAQLVHPEDRDAVLQTMDGAAADSREFLIDFRFLHASGEWRWMEGRGQTVCDETGASTQACGVAIDISERKRAEKVRSLLASIVESSDDAIVSKTLDGRITSWNAGAERLLGYSPDEIIGRHITTIIPPELQHEEQLILAKLGQGERIEHFETVRLAKGGRRIDVSLTVSPVRDASGQVVGASKVARDISDRKLVEQKLVDADRRKDEFLAMLGHELRNPLAPIRNATEVLRQTAGGNVVHEQLCTLLDRQVQYMTRLLDDLLDVSRITHGKIQFQREPLEILTVVTRAIETSRPIIDARRHRLAVSLPEGTARVMGDLTRLVQVLGNVLNNAAKYTPEGGEIIVAAAVRDRTLEVRIGDNGVGITPDILPRIFDIFVQADQTLERSQGGLGIGLTLVRSIVEQHGGTVEATSGGRGLGSEFIVRLPLLDAVNAGGERARDLASGPARSRSCKRVLIVDDNRDSADSLAMLLRLGQHEAAIVSDGHAVLEAVRSFGPDVVLLDIGLPGMNGYDVARQLRRAGWSGTLVALTGYGQPEDRERALRAGFDHHWVKPVDPTALRRLLA